MITIGERLNSSRESVCEAFLKRDTNFLLDEARKQQEAGTHFIDINAAALLEKEIETLRWAIPLLQQEVTIPLSLDTPSPEAMGEALRVHKGRALLNSLTAEHTRMKSLLPLIRAYRPWVIVLCLDEEGIPSSIDRVLSIAEKMVELLVREGLSREDIFIDPLVRPVGVDQNAAMLFLDSLEALKEEIPGVKTIAGLSNVSFGLPRRRLLNRTLFVLAAGRGLDAAILDPCDPEIQGVLAAATALLGKDSSLKNYLKYARSLKPQAD